MAKKWEYIVVTIPGDKAQKDKENQAILNKYGDDGWELVSVIDPSTVYFKREKIS